MALSYVDYTGDNSETEFSLTFDYIKQAHVTVQENEVTKTNAAGAGNYTINETTKKVVFGTAPGTSVRIHIFRTTPNTIATSSIAFTKGSGIREQELDNLQKEDLYIAQEIQDSLKGTHDYLLVNERSSDPANPSEGQFVIWMSDGTGAGDDGDIMIKIQAGAVVKTKTLVDYSA